MKLRLIDSKLEIADIHTFTFEPSEPVAWTPGQYMHYVLEHPEVDDRGVERWFTIASAPYEQVIQITTRIFDDKKSTFKTALNNLKVGDIVEADGPKGKFTLAEGDVKHIFVAGGIGITPYHSMLKQFDHDGKMPHIYLFYANQTDEVVFGDYFQQLKEKYPEFGLKEFIGQRIELVDLQKFVDDPSQIIYLSGPEPMVENYEKMLKDAGLPEDRLRTDFFPGYEAF